MPPNLLSGIPQPVSDKDLLSLAKGDAAAAQRVSAVLKYVLEASREQAVVAAKEAAVQGATEPVSRNVPVVGAYGVRRIPKGTVTVSVGMIVRVREGTIELPSTSDIATRGPANGFVIAEDSQSVQVAAGAAMGPLLVASPAVGEQVLLYTAGIGTCSTSLVGTGTTQVMGVCDSALLDPRGCVRCVNIGVGMETTGDFPDGYVRMNHDNVQQTVPATGVINTTWTGSTTGYLVTFENTNGNMATGTLLAQRSGLGAAYRAESFDSAACFSGIAEAGVALSGENDSSTAFTISAFNNNASARHAEFGSYVHVVGKTIVFADAAGTNKITLAYTEPTGSRTQTFQDATGTIALLEVAQTWTATQTYTKWLTFTPSTTQAITAAGNTVSANARTVVISNSTGGTITLTSTPTIADGENGQELDILNLGPNAVAFNRETGVPGCNLYLGGVTRTLGLNGSLRLKFYSSVGGWVEKSFVTTAI